MELFPELSYDELKEVMDTWLHPEADATNDVPTTGTETASTPANTTNTVVPTSDAINVFDNLFNKAGN